jgi:hypothetical protein
MKDQLVTFKVAKLAKEKGFNIFTENVWLNALRFSEPLEGLHSNITYSGYADDVIQYFRPTQTILQKWLREKFDSDITVITNWNSGIKKYRVGFSYIKDNKIEIWFSKNENSIIKLYDRYEDALEIGLEEAVKSIENCQNSINTIKK